MEVDPLACRYHRHHHRHPWELRYTFLPPRLIAMLIPIHALVWWKATPTWEAALTGIIAFGGRHAELRVDPLFNPHRLSPAHELDANRGATTPLASL